MSCNCKSVSEGGGRGGREREREKGGGVLVHRNAIIYRETAARGAELAILRVIMVFLRNPLLHIF